MAANMYRLIYHKIPYRVLYIFKLDSSGNIVADSYQWQDLKGTDNPVRPRFDEEDENGISTPLIKTSLEVSFIRDSVDQFSDLIDADDDEYMAVAVEQDSEGADPSLNWTTAKKPYLNWGVRCLFKGLLNTESYAEKIVKNAEIQLTFHDKLGQLFDLDFFPKSPQMRFTEILANLLQSCTTSKQLYLTFPYDINYIDRLTGDTWANLKSPRNILLDVANSSGGTKKGELLLDILKSFYLVCYSDPLPGKYSIYNEDPVIYIEDLGVIRIEHIMDRRKKGVYYYQFNLTSAEVAGETEYDYTNTDDSSGGIGAEQVYEERNIIDMDVPDIIPIHNSSGSFDLARKARAIIATAELGLKNNLLFPESFSDEYFDKRSNDPLYSLETSYWRDLFTTDTFGSATFLQKVKDLFDNINSSPKAKANMVGASKKTGVLISDFSYVNQLHGCFSSPILMDKGSATLSYSLEIYTNKSLNYYVELYAYYEGVLYVYKDDTDDWADASGGIGIPIILNPTIDSYWTASRSNIVQPSAIPDGATYHIMVGVIGAGYWYANKQAFLTDMKLNLSTTNVSYPKSIQITTNLSDSRRKPIEFTDKFYNLPEIPDRLSMYFGGILATGLDRNIGQSTEELNSEVVVAPPTFIYQGNEATLLVHKSDMVGLNHVYDRWRFDATIQKIADISEEPISIHTIEGVPYPKKIKGAGAEEIVGWQQVISYGLKYQKLGSGLGWQFLELGEALDKNYFTGDLVDDGTGGTYSYMPYIDTDRNFYYGQTIFGVVIDPMEAPLVVTYPVSDAGSDFALFEGEVIDDGGDEVDDRGFCWGTSINPTISGDHVHVGSGIGKFASIVSGLSSHTTYHMRAFATNSLGTSYGNDEIFITYESDV